ncbi:molybdenum cofactor biosynthesis protein C [Erythrobacter sp. QSSC1-22B]|uniref:cyclic pyranopterin monophosphate synthase MoaC n=1 Tax=Erythrobacter sp. QSSC1-22B TaxID=1860125 RepID=UPI000805742B|nr:cyclic pyranopterin monophosphate synthase MoaC [Erythrobacter sp. QSSC1-22B]OBX20307.1 molybdenum cofactor biosynthesis protein C [Erythrobacter sp. QSSC1-22B]
MSDLSHLDASGAAQMVDVSDKIVSAREAVAEGFIAITPQVMAAIRAGDIKKGDVLGTARIAGIMAAKRTSDLIPLCHPLPITGVSVDFAYRESGIRVETRVRTSGRTGVEMEALTAASMALLTIYDMAKALDKGMAIGPVRLLAKSGGKSGDWVGPPTDTDTP